MKKFIFTLIFILTVSIWGFSQSGDVYVNYKSYKTHYGNGSTSTYNGYTYSGLADNAVELEAMLDVNHPGTSLTHEGEVLANSSQGFDGGRPDRWGNDYYAIYHYGWFQAQETGTYTFSLQSDDGSALWVDGDLKLFRPCCGTSYVDITLTSGQWYFFETKWQEYGGGDYMYFSYSPPSNANYFYVGQHTSSLKVSNSAVPTFTNTVSDGQNAITYKSFKINDYANNNNQGEYNDHPQSSSDFDVMFDYANKNTTTWTHWGRDTATKAFTWPWPNILPRHYNTNFGWIIEGYFVPPTSGTYKFELNSDDRSDFWFDANDDGTITNTGIGLGNGTREIDITNLTAGVSYKFRVRFEQGAGGANLTLKWKSPEDVASGAAFAFNGNSIWSIDADNYVEPLHYDVNYKFRNIDETDFSVNTYYKVSEQEIVKNTNSNSIGLDGWGEATITSQIDETLYSDGNKKFRAIPNEGGIATVLGSNQYGTGNLRFYIDKRMFAAGFDFGSITSVEILDIYSGPMEFQNTDPSSIWQFYKIEGLTLTRDIVSQSQYYLPNGYAPTGIYEMNPQNNHPYPDFVVTNNWAVEDATSFREQYVVFDSPSTTELETLVDDIFTIADVVMAFNELAGGGINGGLKGDFDYNVQYANADVSRDGVFDFKDTQIMIDFLNGGSMFDASYLAAVMSLTKLSEYESMTSTNWINYGTTRTQFPLGLVTGTKQYDKSIAVHWKGDVNMSHSHLPSNIQVTSMAMKSMNISNSPQPTSKSENTIEVDLDIQKIGEEIVVTLNLPQNSKEIVGTEFRIGYDNSRVTFDRIENGSDLQSFSAKRSTYIKLGSISSDGSQNLNGGTEYKIYFKETNNLTSFLGLVSVLKSELVKKDGTQIGVIVK